MWIHIPDLLIAKLFLQDLSEGYCLFSCVNPTVCTASPKRPPLNTTTPSTSLEICCLCRRGWRKVFSQLHRFELAWQPGARVRLWLDSKDCEGLFQLKQLYGFMILCLHHPAELQPCAVSNAVLLPKAAHLGTPVSCLLLLAMHTCIRTPSEMYLEGEVYGCCDSRDRSENVAE